MNSPITQYDPKHKHKYRPAKPGDDGCLLSIHRCDCGATYAKRKRRRAGISDSQCTWHESVPCAQHPNRGNDGQS